jgi:hypothetical protein
VWTARTHCVGTRTLIMILAILLLNACRPESFPFAAGSPTPDSTAAALTATAVPVTPGVNPYAPQANDGDFLRADVHLSIIDLITLEVTPTQIGLMISGALPSPCHALRVVVPPPDAQNQIRVEVYSIVNTAQFCTPVLKQFEARVPLGYYPPGIYTVWVNGMRIGNFSS